MTLAAVVVLASAVRSQDPDRPLPVNDIPPVERAADDFYRAIAAPGRGVKVTWSVTPPAVPLGGDIALTLTVAGAANPRELARPDLRKMAAFTDRFQVTDEPTPAVAPSGEARFAYRLRPRAVGPVEIPPLKYRYYRPAFPEGKRMQTAYADPVAVTVTPPSAPVKPPMPLEAPEEFFAVAARPSLDGPVGVLVPVLLPVTCVPVAVFVWVAVWRKWFPDAVWLADVRRRGAVRSALARLSAARDAADPVAETNRAVRAYLEARWAVPAKVATPSEVAAGLAAAGWPEPRVAAAEGFLRACDAARFSADRASETALTAEAERLILAWERDAR